MSKKPSHSSGIDNKTIIATAHQFEIKKASENAMKFSMLVKINCICVFDEKKT